VTDDMRDLEPASPKAPQNQFQISARPQSIVARIRPRLPTIELSRRASHPDTVLLLSFGWPLGIYWV